MDPFWEAVRMKVCRMCVDGDGRGHCSLPRSEECVLKLMVPEILGLLAADGPRWRKNSVKDMHTRICGRCRHHRDDGRCHEERRGECTLDRFLPVLVEMVQSMGDVRVHQC